MEPTKDQMYQWYVAERKSYRQIMDILGINSARKIKKLLTEYGIEIRKGSEAVKTQWENNHKRRKQQGEIFREVHTGKPSRKRLSDEELQKRIEPYYLKFVSKEVVDGYTVIYATCTECGKDVKTSLRILFGCDKCADKRNGEKQRTPREIIRKLFDEHGVVWLEDEYERITQNFSFICPNHAHLGVQQRSLTTIQKYNVVCRRCHIEKKHQQRAGRITEREKIGSELRLWRIAVLKRDNFTCKCCGDAKGNNLQAHHILNFKTHEHLRLDIDNGITLCKNCHDPFIKGSFHNVYGTRNNNEDQLREYIAMKQQSLV